MRKTLELPEPEDLFTVEEQVLSDLYDAVGSGRNVSFIMTAGLVFNGGFQDYLDKYYEGVIEAGEPYFKELLGHYACRTVHVEFSTGDVPPSKTQRAYFWHRDSSAKRAMICTSLPTVFAVGSVPKNHPLFWAYHRQGPSTHIATQEAVAAGEVGLVRAKINTATRFTDEHLHIGQENTSDEVISRLFCRTVFE